MMKNLKIVKGFFAASWLAVCLPGYALTNSTPHVYPSGVNVALQIGSDLYDSLEAKYRNKLQTPPICAVPKDAPEMALTENNGVNKTLGQISLSVGFVDLINHIAHAKAIDHIQHGYFEKYMSGFGQEAAVGTAMEAPTISEDRYWTDEVMNDQASYFNQMMGLTMAINLSHHYLGQFEKYAGQMQAGKPVAINNYLTETEWDTGVRAAVLNSLQCAFATEGAKALFDAIGKMPHRPAWTAYIVPQNTDIKKLNKQLAKYEVAFFRGELN